MKASLRLCIFLAAALLSGCAYLHKAHDQAGGKLGGPDDYVVQFDDYGKLWDPAVATAALDRVRAEAATTNTVVVVFVHGWNHNAAPDDENAEDFAKSLTDVRKLLRDIGEDGSAGIYRRSREELTGNPDIKVLGVYIGWRGRSLPSLLNYLTFWGRKEAAQRIGNGDLYEFLRQLRGVYVSANAPRHAAQKRPFMGLVSIGHSFGGQALFAAVAATLEEQLLRERDLQSAQSVSSSPNVLSGFGDAVILINPAFEAWQYERIHRLSAQLRYSNLQPPVMLTFSSAGDVPRQLLFPIGRTLGGLTNPPFRPSQREMWVTAMGEHRGHRTHTVVAMPQGRDRVPSFDPAVYSKDKCAVLTLDLSAAPLIAGFKLAPDDPTKPKQPFLNVYAEIKVLPNHVDIFKDQLRYFINDYVALVQGKRMLLSDQTAVSACQ